jgi:hypothetical protein
MVVACICGGALVSCAKDVSRLVVSGWEIGPSTVRRQPAIGCDQARIETGPETKRIAEGSTFGVADRIHDQKRHISSRSIGFANDFKTNWRPDGQMPPYSSMKTLTCPA